MTPEDLKERIEELELISSYGTPLEAAIAAQELAKLKSTQLYKEFKANMGYDVDDAYQYQDSKPYDDNLVLELQSRVNRKSRDSLNIFDALRTIGYTEPEIKQYCRDHKLKYQAPPSINGRMRVN